MTAAQSWQRVVYLSGGVGGARLLDGLARVLPGSALTAVINNGDDFEHWGLRICPDIDTVLYTLSGLGDMQRGWGLRGETFRALERVVAYGGESWFQLGDRDLAMHLVRSERLRAGQSLTAVTAQLAQALGVACTVLPMTDDRLETYIETEHDGVLGFQHWLVRLRAVPRAIGVRFVGEARATPQLLSALEQAQLVIIGPSNPYVSIDPITQLPGVRALLAGKPVIAVSPIVAGLAIKGPLAEMIPALAGREPSAAAIAAHYAPELSAMVVERGDERALSNLPVLGTETVMRNRTDRVRLAREVLSFARERLAPA